MGGTFLAATAKSSGGSSLLPILIIVALFGVLYVTMIRPNQNRRRQSMQMQNTIAPGTKIRTTAGMYGTVKSVEDQDVVVEVAPGVDVRMLRRAVMDVIQDGSFNGAAPAQEPPADEREPRAGDLDPQDRNI
jgi:preprotein translocase subunit YajC